MSGIHEIEKIISGFRSRSPTWRLDILIYRYWYTVYLHPTGYLIWNILDNKGIKTSPKIYCVSLAYVWVTLNATGIRKYHLVPAKYYRNIIRDSVSNHQHTFGMPAYAIIIYSKTLLLSLYWIYRLGNTIHHQHITIWFGLRLIPPAN